MDILRDAYNAAFPSNFELKKTIWDMGNQIDLCCFYTTLNNIQNPIYVLHKHEIFTLNIFYLPNL